MCAILNPTLLVLENLEEILCAERPTLEEKGAQNCLYDLVYLNHKINHKENQATLPPQIKEPSTYMEKNKGGTYLRRIYIKAKWGNPKGVKKVWKKAAKKDGKKREDP